jgi:hypothetical protein
MVCMTTWACRICGKPLALQKTTKNGFWLSVFENEDGSPRALRDDTQARVITSDSSEERLFDNIICWHCSQQISRVAKTGTPDMVK